MSASDETLVGRRGQPVIALMGVIVVWISIRMLFWQSPLALPALPSGTELPVPADLTERADAPVPPQAAPDLLPRVLAPPAEWQAPPVDRGIERPLAGPESGDPTQLALADQADDPRPVPARRIVGHTMLLAAGLAHMPMAPGLEAYLQDRGPAAGRFGAGQSDRGRTFLAAGATAGFARDSRAPRWSADGWVLLRADNSAPNAAVQPSYGRSQAGAVLRRALAPGDAHRPQAYLRATTALDGPREHEAALGLSARPIGELPVRLAAEARLADNAQQTEVRAAILAISEFPPLALPAGMTAEAYLQAGYVTGNFSTGFVDGLARVGRDVASLRDFRLSAGGGAWGGVQQGAERLDVGPSATVTFPVGEGFGRLSAEYRFRVAGEAEPASGPALTLSAGF